MKYVYAALALAAAVRAQTRDDIPECAIPCLDDAIQSETDCAVDDYPCVCENFETIQGVATSCVIEECGPETALNEVLPAVEALCENAGSEPTSSSEPTEEPTSEPTSSDEETAPTSAPEETTVHTTLTKTECSHGCEEPTAVPTHAPTNGTVPEPTGEPSPVPTGAAAAFAPMGGLALAGLAVLAL